MTRFGEEGSIFVLALKHIVLTESVLHVSMCFIFEFLFCYAFHCLFVFLSKKHLVTGSFCLFCRFKSSICIHLSVLIVFVFFSFNQYLKRCALHA